MKNPRSAGRPAMIWRGAHLIAVVVAAVVREPLRLIRRIMRKALAWLRFAREFRRFKYLDAGSGSRLSVEWRDRLAFHDERTATTDFDRHYIYHVAWAARVLARTHPARHVDISSTLYLCSAVSAFISIEFLDYRPPNLNLDNLSVDHGDLLSLPFTDQSLESISCLHVAEHVGLGRYGDPLDPQGDLKAISELKRVVAVGGQLLFVVPVGRPRVVFNGHRIYSYAHIASCFDGWKLEETALIPDSSETGHLIYSPAPELMDAQCYGCGCFLFRRMTE